MCGSAQRLACWKWCSVLVEKAAMLREIAGRYQLQRKLGSGAWATVYEALDTGAIGRRVAIKVFRLMPPDDGASAAEEHARFRQGARAAGRLSHPNVVSVFDYGEDSEVAWIVMEMVEGETLKALLDRQERLPAPVIVRLMGQVLDALAYTHSRGVVHRDIKPANIMLTEDRVVKIADFGVARIENSSMTHVGTVLGSPAYMAPEQFRGDATDHRADIWAAGVILYQMLTGERPFEGGVTSVMQKALYVEPVLPSLTKAAVPAQFDAVVAKAMAKRLEDRFSSAEDFAKAIREAAAAAAAAGGSDGAPLASSRPPPADATLFAPRASPRERGSRPRPPHPPAQRAAAQRMPPPRTRSRRPWAVVAGGIGAVAVAAGVAGFVFVDPPVASFTWPRSSELGAGADAPRSPAQPAAPGPSAAASPTAAPGPLAGMPSQAELFSPVPPSGPAARSAAPPAAEPPPPVLAARSVPPPVVPPPPPDAAAMAVPSPPFRPPAPSRQDYEAAAAAALSTITCGVVLPVAGDSGVSLTGVARRDQTVAAEAAIGALGIPASATRLWVEPFDGPYCEVLSQVRGIALNDGAPQVTLSSPDPLPGGEVLRFRVQTPAWSAHLHVAFLMTTGEVGNLFNTTARQAPRSSITLTDPKWEATEPYGTDLLLVIASERPLFGAQRRRKVEKLDQFAADLAPALSAAQERGGRVSAQVVAVRTVMPRQGAP
jgi:eukaryotic-like serine/threonine-protein kinase